MTNTVDPRQYIEDAEVLYSTQDVSSAIQAIAATLNADYHNDLPVLLSVMTGASYFTGQLLPYLNFPLELDYVHATRYQGGLEGKSVQWVVEPKAELKSRSVLILDDILDEGLTLKSIIDACHALGAKQVKVAVLVNKELNKTKPVTADYMGIVAPNRYIFGCGMDINGWWRNLPAIYALKTV